MSLNIFDIDLMPYLKAFEIPIMAIVFVALFNLSLRLLIYWNKKVVPFLVRVTPTQAMPIEYPTMSYVVSVPTLETRHASLHLRLVKRQSLAELMRKALRAQGRRFISIEEKDLFFRLSQTMPFYYTGGVNSDVYANDPSTLRR